MTSFPTAFRETLFFALPVVAGQIGHMLFGVGDTLFLGHYGTVDLSALGIATALSMPFFLIGMGITYVISPLKARAGRDENSAFVRTSLRAGLCIGIVLAVLFCVLARLVPHMGYSADVTAGIQVYLRITAVSNIPALIFQVLRENLQARERTAVPNAIILAFNAVNLLLNYAAVFSLDLGIAGAALATTVSRFLMCAVLWRYSFCGHLENETYSAILMKRIFVLGIPAGLTMVLTAGMFSLVTLLSGYFSVEVSGANNIIITISSVSYMVPYALASAVSVKMGQKQNQVQEMRIYYTAAVVLGQIFAVFTAVLFISSPQYIFSLASSDSTVAAAGVPLLILVGIYQIPDSFQCITAGALRGCGITVKPMLYTAAGVWGVGLVTALILAFPAGLDAAGLWAGLAVGINVTAVAGFRTGRKVFLTPRSSSQNDTHYRSLQRS
ncbi:MAG: MATE family efflux transporter [Fibrobacterota bacterium]